MPGVSSGACIPRQIAIRTKCVCCYHIYGSTSLIRSDIVDYFIIYQLDK